MSRIGRLPISVPSQVKVQVQGDSLTLEGPKGRLSHRLPPELKLEQEAGVLRVRRNSDEKRVKGLHGLHRSLVYNMVKGVTEGFVKELELMGVGYRAQVSGQKLEMFVGFTHPVVYPIPAGLSVETPKPTQILIRGMDKCLVGQAAAHLRAIAPPEPYKGKGIRYAGEVIRRKAGKAVA